MAMSGLQNWSSERLNNFSKFTQKINRLCLNLDLLSKLLIFEGRKTGTCAVTGGTVEILEKKKECANCELTEGSWSWHWCWGRGRTVLTSLPPFSSSSLTLLRQWFLHNINLLLVTFKFKTLHWLPIVWALKTDVTVVWIYLSMAMWGRRMLDSSRTGLSLADVIERQNG